MATKEIRRWQVEILRSNDWLNIQDQINETIDLCADDDSKLVDIRQLHSSDGSHVFMLIWDEIESAHNRTRGRAVTYDPDMCPDKED